MSFDPYIVTFPVGLPDNMIPTSYILTILEGTVSRLRLISPFTPKSVWCWDKMCYYALKIKCQSKLFFTLWCYPAARLSWEQMKVLAKVGEKGKKIKRSHFADVYFGQTLQHKLWLHLVSRPRQNIRKRKNQRKKNLLFFRLSDLSRAF